VPAGVNAAARLLRREPAQGCEGENAETDSREDEPIANSSTSRPKAAGHYPVTSRRANDVAAIVVATST
jgi:hypothetical protein